MAEIQLKQVRSSNGISPSQRATLRSLGLGRIGRQSSHPDSPQLQGMVRVVRHLIEVENG
ncbi:MAG: 50S ribosomal protein L30 [Solirubrobacterales bacterium]